MITTTVEAAPVVQADGEYLYIDGQPCCPLCLEDAGSEWCNCLPGLAMVESDRREAGR